MACQYLPGKKRSSGQSCSDVCASEDGDAAIGEELWEVHLKRSENMNDEEDKDTLEMPDGKEMSEKSLLDGDETCEASNHDTKDSVPLCDTVKEKKSVQSKTSIDVQGS